MTTPPLPTTVSDQIALATGTDRTEARYLAYDTDYPIEGAAALLLGLAGIDPRWAVAHRHEFVPLLNAMTVWVRTMRAIRRYENRDAIGTLTPLEAKAWDLEVAMLSDIIPTLGAAEANLRVAVRDA